VFKNEPIQALNGESDWIICAGSAEKYGGCEYLSKKRQKREYGITIAEEGMKISFVFSLS
jgi:hypothetical protein